MAAKTTKDFTNRILVAGTTLATAALGATAAFMVWGLADRIKSLRQWTHADPLSWLVQGSQLLFNAVLPVLVVALIVRLWARIIIRRRILGGLSGHDPNPFTPRGKYAFWNPSRRTGGRHAAFGSLRVRKKMKH